MALNFWTLTKPATKGAMSHVDGVKLMVTEATDATEARVIANQYDNGDDDWSDADAALFTAGGSTDLEGWFYQIKVSGANPGDADEVNVSVTGGSADDADAIGAALVAALVAKGLTASYAASVVDVAAIADGLGDRTIEATYAMPNAAGRVSTNAGSNMAFGTITHEGIAAAALKVGLQAFAGGIPRIIVRR